MKVLSLCFFLFHAAATVHSAAGDSASPNSNKSKKELVVLYDECTSRETEWTAQREQFTKTVAKLEQDKQSLTTTVAELDQVKAQLLRDNAANGNNDDNAAALQQALAKADDLQERIGQLEASLAQAQAQNDEAHATTRSELQSSRDKITEQERHARELIQHKDELEGKLKSVQADADGRKTRETALRKELDTAGGKIQELEHEMNFSRELWEDVIEFKDDVVAMVSYKSTVAWTAVAAFTHQQYSRKEVQEIVQPMEAKIAPVWKNAVVATKPGRDAVAEGWATVKEILDDTIGQVHVTLSEKCCLVMESLATFCKEQQLPRFLIKLTRKAHQNCEGIFWFNEILFGFWILPKVARYVWRLFFGKKKKTVKVEKKKGGGKVAMKKKKYQ